MPSGIQEEQTAVETTRCGVATVAICVATYRRAEGIRRLLQALEKLEFQVSPIPSVRVIVADNDPSSGVGQQVCRNFPNFRWDLKLLAEEQRGISFARNTALHEALAVGADAVAFIDDDETPDPGWLDVLLEVQASSGADIVSGPVLPLFEGSVPTWVIKGKFFERPRFPTGTLIRIARTGNLLILTRVLKNLDVLFDERFGLSGGEDTLLTSRLQRDGARIVWADDAVVREWIPRDRAKARYILRRAFAGGSNWARIEHTLDPRPWMTFKRGATGVARIAQGSLPLLPSILLGRHAVVRSAAKACLGMGMLSGLLGFSSRSYGPSRAI
ncbi:MAG: glycosyltransferase [Acidobacteriia bacterium]|nr:glycosyltransferase [Terriglobia bacterium]